MKTTKRVMPIALKAIALTGALLSGAAAWSAPRIDVTSFVWIGGPNSRLAEICGRVSEPPEAVVPLNIRIDANTKSEGEYHTFSTETGRFCHVVVTYGGRAEVSFVTHPGQSSSPVVRATAKR